MSNSEENSDGIDEFYESNLVDAGDNQLYVDYLINKLDYKKIFLFSECKLFVLIINDLLTNLVNEFYKIINIVKLKLIIENIRNLYYKLERFVKRYCESNTDKDINKIKKDNFTITQCQSLILITEIFIEKLIDNFDELLSKFHRNNLNETEFLDKITFNIKDVQNLCKHLEYYVEEFNKNELVQNLKWNINNNDDKDILEPIYCRYSQYCKYCPFLKENGDKNCWSCNICNNVHKGVEKRDILNIINQITNNEPKIKIVNNTTINININNNYIKTKDRYYEVIIRSDGKHDDIIKKIKRAFIYSMCRSKAVELFPGEKHNLSTTFPLTAGIYTIKYDNDIPYLKGLLRYQYTQKTIINENKLKTITSYVDITVKPIHDICKIDKQNLENAIQDITSDQYYGSPIEQFYLNN